MSDDENTGRGPQDVPAGTGRPRRTLRPVPPPPAVGGDPSRGSAAPAPEEGRAPAATVLVALLFAAAAANLAGATLFGVLSVRILVGAPPAKAAPSPSAAVPEAGTLVRLDAPAAEAVLGGYEAATLFVDQVAQDCPRSAARAGLFETRTAIAGGARALVEGYAPATPGAVLAPPLGP